MPTSEKQRKMMAIAEHEPGKLFKRNKGVLSMGKSKLHEFSSSTVKKSSLANELTHRATEGQKMLRRRRRSP